jgi:hypothetical protein
MTYIEARLIVPTEPNAVKRESWREAYETQLALLERDLVRTFGGYTATEGRGAWDTGEGAVQYERVRVYLLSFEGLAHDPRLHYLRDMVKERLDQKAVYLSHTIIEDEAVL